MELVQMQKSLQDYTKSLFLDNLKVEESVLGVIQKLEFMGVLDSQFLQLQQLQDESNPHFVSQVVTLFFQDSDRILNDLSLSLDQQVVDFKKVYPHVHQLKGSSSSIGAQRVKNACVVFRSFCEQQNVEGCHRCLQQVKKEYYLVKNRLETLFKLEQQIVASGGMIPAMELGF
ncbi:hypothetical protein IGI04_003047 [Brassica rapa subsp. trilocularis]|uniref:Histidine-containing phosphotransfer protein n=1 Tax=Brassica rapa subsp. trilocularis TaxID=1813537 RepID=A0ABQ7NZB5_BRACM|nr:hypothetical protein IGI04_003047 [Brassica rapa subsp. trilocularis]